MNVGRSQNHHILIISVNSRMRRPVGYTIAQIDLSARLRFVNNDGKIAIIPCVVIRAEIESSNRKGLGRGAGSRVRLLDSLGAQFPEDGREKSHPLDKRLWRGGRAGVGRAGQGQKARTTATSACGCSVSDPW